MKRYYRITAACVALMLSVSLYGCGVQIPNGTTQVTTAPPLQTTAPPATTAPSTVPNQTTSPPTTVPETTAPTVPETAAPTVPETTEALRQCIGSLYTAEELEAMDNTLTPYGSGYATNGMRPEGVVGIQQRNEDYAACFIADDTKDIYLTFDCGYEYNNLTADILDTLKEKEVKAAFFVTLSYCKRNPELVRRIINEGHTLGNHSVNHYSMPSCSIDEMVSEIMELHEYVKENFDGYEMTLFRPPMGEYSVRSLCAAQTLGYRSVFWSFAYRDWLTDDQPAPQEALAKICGAAHNGAIYLLHAVSETNTAVLPDVIDSLHAQGYTLKQYA